MYACPAGERTFLFKVYRHTLYCLEWSKVRKIWADHFRFRSVSPRIKGTLEKVSLDLLSKSESITDFDECHVWLAGTRFLADKYKLDMSSPANISNLSNAIKRGALKGQLTLPSGIAGRVKTGTKVSEVAIPVFGTFIDLICRSLLLFTRSP